MRNFLLSICLGAGLGACAQFPALEGTISDEARAAPYPKLTPLGPQVTLEQDGIDAELKARVDALNARAAVLRETDLDALQ